MICPRSIARANSCHLFRVLNSQGRFRTAVAMSTAATKYALPSVAIIAIVLLSACQVTFSSDSGQSRNTPGRVKTFYIPSAADRTSHGGMSWRVTQALRRELAKYPSVVQTSEEKARVAIDIQIKKIVWIVATTAECDPKADKTKNTRIGSEAYQCGDIKSSLQQAEVASETEVLDTIAVIGAIDLETGKSLFRTELPARSAITPVVGPATLASNLADRPEFHALRYAENRDLMREQIANQLAIQIVPQLLNLRLSE
jgi:hypothetical protein